MPERVSAFYTEKFASGTKLDANLLSINLLVILTLKFTMKKFGILVLCLLLTMGVGALSGVVSDSGETPWFASLNKPSIYPPGEVFFPVWTALYFLMGISLYLVVISTSRSKKTAILFFVIQLILNFIWSIIFFNWHQIGFALIEILALWLVIILMIGIYFRINKWAAYLQIPYLLWVSFATVLTAAFFSLNG